MPSIDIQVRCGQCGAVLEADDDAINGMNSVIINVEPCPMCEENTRKEAYEEGKADASQ